MHRKRWFRAGLGLAFVAQFVLADVLLAGKASALFQPRAWIFVVASFFWWSFVLAMGERRAARAIAALFAAFLLIVQLEFFRHYHSFLDLDAALAAKRSWPDVRAVVGRILPWALAGTVLLASVEYLCLSFALRPRARTSLVFVFLGGGAVLFLPRGAGAPPDVQALGALRAPLQTAEARAAGRVEVPKLASTRHRLPNVLFILGESVRAKDYCGGSTEACETAPETAALLPERVALRELRSLASYTSISANALLAGKMPLGTKSEIVRTPLVFDYLHAVRAGETRPQVLFWSAQADSLFERSDVRGATDSYVTVEDFVGHPIDDLEDVLDQRVDDLLAKHVERALPAVKTPFFLMLQLCGTHAPYFVDEAHAPFRPYTRSASFQSLEPLHNAYKNAILAQDQSVARMLRTFFARVGNEPWMVVITSDHGEAFGEHKAIHHGQNLYDEQIHVPGVIAFGGGALDQNEIDALRSHAGDFVTHLDLVPTLLDVYGVLDSFGLAAYKSGLSGRSLLRNELLPPKPSPATNCSPLFPCPLRNWGVLAGRYGLVAQAWDAGWRCVDFANDADGVDLGTAECAGLVAASKSFWPTLPNGRDNR